MSESKLTESDVSAISPIRATLAVEPAPGVNCDLIEEGHDVDVLDQNLTFDFSDLSDYPELGECHTNVYEEGGSETANNYVQSDLSSNCFCLAFHESECECVSSIQRVEGDTIIVSVVIPDRKRLRNLIERVRQTGATVRVTRLVQPSAESANSVVIDVTDVTEKQREALEAAIDAGYYETPREADLETLAKEIGVSKSAVSQRLKAVESRLVHKLADNSSADDSRSDCSPE